MFLSGRSAFATIVGAVFGAMLGACALAQADPLFTDSFALQNSYAGAPAPGKSAGRYTVIDGTGSANSNPAGTWTARDGTLTYSRSPSNPATSSDNYNYVSSLLLSTGTTPATGNTAGLSAFTVTTTFNAIPPANTAQQGLIVSGSIGSGPGTGGYVLEDDNGQGSRLVLLAETGNELLGDEAVDGAGTGQVIGDCGSLTAGDSYKVSVTEYRSSDASGHTSFSATIVDLGPSNKATAVYSFSDKFNSGTFGGTLIGLRVRDPLDTDKPSFGPLCLSLPAP
jgi:hypothetical protein